MTEIKSILKQIYGDENVDLLSAIDQLKHQYKTPRSVSALSERDVCLITYGNSIIDPEQRPLAVMQEFLSTTAQAFSTVHILPFYPYTSDDGFSVIDYKKVNPGLGDWADIEKIGENKNVMFDAVINHISASSAWVNGHLEDDPAYVGFVLEEDLKKDWSRVVRPRTSPLLHEFKKASGQQVALWTTFSSDQVDLNYRNPKLLIAILDVLCYYGSKGARLIRLDAIGFMWKEEGSSCIHLSKTHLLIQLMRRVLEGIFPEIKLVTETNVPHIENISYFGNGNNEAHMVYNFTLPPLMAFSLLTQDSSKFQKWAMSLELPSNQVCFFNFLASHDGVGLRPIQGILDTNEVLEVVDSAKANGGTISYKTDPDRTASPYEVNCNYFDLLKGKKRDQTLGVKKMLLAHAVLLSMPGLPAIYIHSLLGSVNDLEAVQNGAPNRSINREKIDFRTLKEELKDPNSIRSFIYKGICQMVEIRSAIGAFDPVSKFSIVETSKSLFHLKRFSSGEEVDCVFNFSESNHTYELTKDSMDLITGEKISKRFELKPFAYLWLKI
ncbi:MAG: sucrose phosphorylase [Cyclobacteriaceae bacterium]|jgi:glycosidase